MMPCSHLSNHQHKLKPRITRNYELIFNNRQHCGRSETKHLKPSEEHPVDGQIFEAAEREEMLQLTEIFSSQHLNDSLTT